ncbi:MAG: hypothetical protein ACREHE_03435 [Rhizomicrobium sp.]
MSRNPHMGNFILVCFALAAAAEAGAVAFARIYPDQAMRLSHANGLIFYGIPVVLCGIAGAVMGVWTRDSILRNFLATLICLFVPFGAAVLGVYLSCMFLRECLL